MFMLFVIAGAFEWVHSQTIHFSDAYAAHLTLNPANTGRFNGDWRATSIIRDQGFQFPSHYKTAYFSFEMPVYIHNERIATGLFYSHDNSSTTPLTADRLYANIATSVPLWRQGSLTAGLQMGMVNKYLSWENLSNPDQYNRETGGFDPSLPTAEMFDSDKASWFDIGIGLTYLNKLPNALAIVGYAVQQLNTPDESFLGQTNTLPIRQSAQVKIDWSLGDSYFVIPSALGIWQGGAFQSLAGANIGMNLDDWLNQQNSFLVGVHFRNGLYETMDAFIFTAGLTVRSWSLTVSFDTDIVGAKTGNTSLQAFELGLVFKRPSTELLKKTVPCERY